MPREATVVTAAAIFLPLKPEVIILVPSAVLIAISIFVKYWKLRMKVIK
ncbi:MAG: hypothetical protein PWP65_803 [Clostridia bacterium]|nr:hypothetical protein [Clostridia bacterium]